MENYSFKKYSAALFMTFIISAAFSQTTFYNINTIQKIEVFFSQPNWDYQMDTAKHGLEGYTLADSIKINGILLDSIGVKYKGNSSYDSTYKKNPLHIELNHFKNQSYQGVQDIKLGNGYSDPSMIREVLAYDILKNYMHCPRANFAMVYINGIYIGIYSNAENIDKDFCSNHFYSSNNTFFKCNPTVVPGPTKKSNLKYISTDSSQYFDYYELKSNTGWNDLVKLCDTVTNFSSGLSTSLDIDRVLWMLAYNNVLINLDSYTGVFAQNYYIYKDHTNHYNPIIWDLNMAFGGFPYAGSGNTSMGSLTVANMQQLTPLAHSTDVYWPLIKNVLANPMFKRMYIAHMKTITNEIFANNNYQISATQFQTLIDTAVAADSNKFFSYAQFQNGMTGNVVVGTYTVPGITTLMSSRNTYLQSTTEYQQSAPIITSVNPSNTSPSINTTVTITANVTNTNSGAVYLGYRNLNSEKFIRVLMYDDGNHNDGTANDNVYGASFTITSSKAEYYIYAENNNAGMFSPERAEHEFYSLNANVQTATVGQVVINEFLALNQTGQQNETGQYQDWIELYNTTNSPLDLFGLYLTDNYNNKTKFAFPSNSIIQAKSYVTIWADENPITTSAIHCNFKLSGSGERLMLSNVSGTVLDSITFAPQTADVSMARCPNGTGTFATSTNPTYNNSNCSVGINELFDNEIKIYPSPSSGIITVETKNIQNSITIYNQLGQKVFEKSNNTNTSILQLDFLPQGIYQLVINNNTSRKIQIIK